jgi:hypothetical protein
LLLTNRTSQLIGHPAAIDRGGANDDITGQGNGELRLKWRVNSGSETH